MFMLKNVIMTFIGAIATYITLIVGFALCFTIVIFNSDSNFELENETGYIKFDNFRNSYLGIFKTTIMLTGEFNVTNMNFSDPFDKVVFVVFFLLVSIVLLNLINGLTVTDVLKIKQDGEMHAFCRLVRVLSKYEELTLLMKLNYYLKCFASNLPSLEIDFKKIALTNHKGSLKFLKIKKIEKK